MLISIPAYKKLGCTIVNVQKKQQYFITLNHGMFLKIYIYSNQTMQKLQMMNNQSLLMKNSLLNLSSSLLLLIHIISYTFMYK